MAMRLSSVCVAVTLLSGGGVRAQAPGPSETVSLDLTDRPLTEALAALQKASGIECEVVGELPSAPNPPRVTFRCEQMPVKRALRAVCEAAGCHYQRVVWDRWWIEAGGFPDRLMPSVTVEGYIVRLSAITVSTTARRGFGGEASAAEGGAVPQMQLDLLVDAPTDTAGHRVFGLDQAIRAIDDQGRVASGGPVPGRIIQGQGFLDASTWQTTASLSAPAADAKTITIEGSLVLYDECVAVQFRFPWGQVDQKQSDHGFTVTTKEFAAPAQGDVAATLAVERPDPELPLNLPLSLTMAGTSDIVGWVEWKDGTRTMWTSGGGTLLRFRRPGNQTEAPVALIVRGVARVRPTKRLPFRLENLALPAEVAKVGAAGAAEPPHHAYWARPEEAGGFGFDVMVEDQFVVGPLDIPISIARQREDGKWGEWADLTATVDEDGHVGVGNLRPGHYSIYARSDGMGEAGPDFAERLGRAFGIDHPEQYLWINQQTWMDVQLGVVTPLDTVRFVKAVKTLTPASGATVRKGDLRFSWEPYPKAVTYQLRLTLKLGPNNWTTFWETTVPGTEFAWDPAKGNPPDEGGRQYLDLQPGREYQWHLVARDAGGKEVSQGRGGRFYVE